MTRHKSKSVLLQKMQELVASPTLEIRGERAKRNPLAAMDDGDRPGPLYRLLEAWAIAGEVLTFYQQRIADERALSTAREDRSAYAIARGMGYDPRPAISAETSLAFQVKDPSGRVLIPKGTPIGNIPPPGSRPAIFETSDDLTAYSDWNLVPVAIDAQPVAATLERAATRLRVRGTTPVASGSALVLRLREGATGKRTLTAIVADATVDAARNTTLLRWTTPMANDGGDQIVEAFVLETRVRPVAALAPPFPLASPPERRPYLLGGVALRRDGGWTRVSEGLESAPIALALTRNGLYGITATQFVRRAPGDAAWVASSPFAGGVPQTIVATPGGRLAVGTTTGGVFVSIDDGLTWTPAGPNRLPPVPVHAIAIDERHEAPVVYVATDHGIASLTLNGDAWTWRNDGLPGTDPKTGFASAAAMSLALTDGGATLLAATTYGVFRSRNGEPWVRIPGVGSVAQVAAVSESRLIVAGAGGVFRSTDGALTWDRVLFHDATPRALAVNVASAAVAIGSVVYASDDGGATWSPLSDALQSKPAALAVGPDGGLAVAAPFVENPAPEWPAHPNWPHEGWPALDESLGGHVLQLDRELPLRPGDELVVSKENDERVVFAYQIASVKTAQVRRYGIAATSSAVVLHRALDPSLKNPRDAVVFVAPRARDVVPVVAAVSAPPAAELPVPRGLQPLAAGRTVAIEGRLARVLLGGLAGGPLWIRPGTADAVAPPAALAAFTQPADGTVFPLLDVVAATATAARGVALARFDGVWWCDDVTAPVWKSLGAPPFEPCSLAWHDDTFYACGAARDEAAGGVYAFASGNSWTAQPVPNRSFSRLVVVGGVLYACGDPGLFARDANGWALADPLFATRAVFDVAGDANATIAGTEDGVYVRAGGTWTRAAGFDGYVVTAVAIDGGTWYAGTHGRGTFASAAGSGAWAPVDRRHRSGHVRALCVAGGTVLAAEQDRGIARRGVQLGVPLANGVISFVPLSAELGGGAITFRGVPFGAGTLGVDARSAMRTFVGLVPLDPDDGAMLDAGALAPELQNRLEELVQVKLGTADVVVESAGRAWRLDADPVVLVRREPSGLSVFEVARFELATPPTGFERTADALRDLPPGTCGRWPLSARPGSPPLLARADELVYAPAAPDAPLHGEIATVAHHDPAALRLSSALRTAYDARTVTIAGNVAAATHGATIPAAEQIASGDASIAAQTAKLVNKPLTNLLRDNLPEPELNVWVRAKTVEDPFATTAALAHGDAGLAWQRAVTLPAGDRRARAYVVRQDSDGAATLTFGDGERGRRLPTGDNNVVARYRIGGGADGNLARAQLTLFQRMLPGHERVWNPLASTGGVPAENVTDLADVRRTVSRGLVSLDRVVSRRDLEDYVRAWPGVEKADVTPKRAGRQAPSRPSFTVTIALAGDLQDGVSGTSDAGKLRHALRRDGATSWDIDVQQYRARRFAVAATLYVAELPDGGAQVQAAATNALSAHFSWRTRALREDVTRSAIVAELQRVPGVAAVALHALYEIGSRPGLAEVILGDDLDTDMPASLLTIEPSAIVLDVTTAALRAPAQERLA